MLNLPAALQHARVTMSPLHFQGTHLDGRAEGRAEQADR